MKKLGVGFVCVCIIFVLIQMATSSRPRDMSDEVYECGVNVLKVADKYIAGETTAYKAYKKIGELADDTTFRSDVESEKIAERRINSLHLDLMLIDTQDELIGDKTIDDVKKSRKELARAIGE